MINFFKKQINKIIIGILIDIIALLIGFIFKIPPSILINTLFFINYIFTIFIGKTWFEDYKMELNKELEKSKNELNKELEKYKTRLSGYTIVTKMQYDLEFKIYTEIYEKIFLFFIETNKLRSYTPIVNPNADNNLNERLNFFIKFYNETLNVINRYKPFYSKEIYLSLEGIRKLCYKEYLKVAATNHIDFNYLESDMRKQEIQKRLDELSVLIRKRIENMKIIED